MAATMVILNAKCSPKMLLSPTKPANPSKPTSLLPSKPITEYPTLSISIPSSTAMAAAIFSTLSSCDSAMAAQQIAEIAEGDNRGLALLLPLVPAIGWVLYNIFQPTVNQINRMRSTRGVIVGLGLGGLGASGLMAVAPDASAAAEEMAAIADAAASDNRGQLLLFVVTPALLWVLYNILQPALNQINKMRS